MERSFKEGTFILFDIENTGGNPERNGITEIAALKVRKGEIIDTFYSMVNPKMAIPPIVRKMTGITNKMVKKAPTIYEVMPEFVDFIEDDVLASHNTIGDMRFIRHFAKKVCDIDLLNYYLCTHLLAEKLLPAAPDKSLKGLVSYIGENRIEDFHRADADAYATKYLFDHLVKKLAAQDITIIKDAIRFQGDLESALRLGWGLSADDVHNAPRRCGVYQLLSSSGELVFYAAAENVAADLKKLSRFNDLPKQLLKSVLQAVELKITPFASLQEAFMFESELAEQHPTRYSLINWNQKSGKFVYINTEKTAAKLTMGPLVEASEAVFGPIFAEREGYDFIGMIADVEDVKLYGNSVTASDELRRQFNDWLSDDSLVYKSLRLPLNLAPLDMFTGIFVHYGHSGSKTGGRDGGQEGAEDAQGGKPSGEATFHFIYKGRLTKSVKVAADGWPGALLKYKISHAWRTLTEAFRPKGKGQIHHHQINRVSWWVGQEVRHQRGEFFTHAECSHSDTAPKPPSG